MEMSSLGTDASQEIGLTPEIDIISGVTRLDLSSAHETAVGKIQTWLLSYSHQMSLMDPFTQNLLERTKASRSKLEAKLSNTPQPLPRKRRSPLKEDLLPEIIHSKLKEQNNYPEKRQCFEQHEEVDDVEAKENIRETKENVRESKENRIKSPEKKNKSYTDQREYNNSVLTTKIKASARIPLDECGDIVQKRSNRLARLAAQINSWEDDLKGDAACPVPKLPVERELKPEPPIAQSRSNPLKKTPVHDNRSIPIPSSRTSTSPRKSSRVIEPEAPRSAVRVSKSPAKADDISENALSLQACAPQASPRRRSSSFTGSSLSSPARPIISKKQSFSAEKPKRTTKTIVWDQAVVATLEAQGFTQSPSKSKLEYKFNRNAGSPKKKVLTKESETESSDEDCTSDSSSSSEDVQMSPRAAIKQSPFKRAETERVSVRQLAEKFAAPFAASTPQRDPAQLPLSARVALFEKEAQVQSKNAAATAFKKPSSDSNRNFVIQQSPAKLSLQKINSGVREREKQVEESNVKVSPTKPVGAHTFQLHRQLFEHGKDWKENEISLRIKEDRDKDMEVVLNRWSYKNKQAAESAALSATQQRVGVPQQQQPKAEPKKPVYNAPVVKNEIPTPPPLPIQHLNFPTSPRDNCFKDKDIYDDDSLSETESDDEGLQELEPYVDSEEELNRALAEVDAISTTDDDADTDMDSSILKAFKQIDNENESITEKEKSPLVNVTFKMPSTDRVFATPKKYDDSSEEKSDEEQQLVHTISFYRRQNEISRYTATKKIIRNENQSSASTSDSTSNDDDDYYQSDEIQQSFQEKVKHLQDEIISQQAVMRQASQALVLCRSNELFQGSLEQIEGERLLLVSAQKRQACVNEIEKLKMDSSLGVRSSNRRHSKGSLSMGDIKLVLKREFLEQTANGKSGDFVHFFICLIKHGAQVIASQMMSTMDGVSSGALHFPNLINIRDLERDFNVIVEVYGLQTKRECVNREYKTLSNKKDKSKLTLTPKKRQSKKDLKMMCPKIQSPGGPNVICSSSFALIGFTALNLMTMNKKSWNLEKVPFVSPLEGSLVMKVRCFSDFKTEEQGFLTMFDDVAGYGNWYRRWFVLTDKVLSYWKYPDDVKQKAPIGQIDLCQCITSDVCLVARDICARPHTFMLIIVRPPSKETTDSLIVHNFKSYATIKVLLSADTKEERISWCQYMNRTLENLRTWDPQALKPMPDDFELRNQL